MDFPDRFIGIQHACVAVFHGYHGRALQFWRDRGTTIGNQGDVETQVAGIPDCGGHTFVAVDAHHEQAGNLHIAQDVINIGIDIITTELEFNEKAGITQEMNDIPEFFRIESSEPIKLKFSFDKDDLKTFWSRLNEYNF